MTDVYEKVRARLDEWATGFPETESKVELKVLKNIFSPDEAALFLEMAPFPESADEVALRLGKDTGSLSDMLETMAQKGQLFRVRKKGLARYSAVPFVVGLMEFQLNNLATNSKLAMDMAIYGKNGFIKSLASLSTPHQRAVPINTEIVTSWPIAPYDDAIAIIKRQKKIAVANCVCRTMVRKVTADLCEKPLETCMMFGAAADYYIENKMGRSVGVDEALDILKICDEHALVVQPLNSKDSGAICACCGDCCGMMTSLKMQEKPAEAVKSSYFARIDEDACVGCEVCLDRCQIDAITMQDDKARINLDRCIGCGLCVTKCPSEALSLIKKPQDLLYDPPENHMDMYVRMGMERGKI
ncbi:MAG: 4Fe-4S binding protein [Proteobacteria bacterium]|nr:4Fe-4S binding protein [Pseudomonadota bacterium]